ncbi:MAG: hypothetical protein AAB875_04130 [Patescibacteria group bacterium]
MQSNEAFEKQWKEQQAHMREWRLKQIQEKNPDITKYLDPLFSDSDFPSRECSSRKKREERLDTHFNISVDFIEIFKYEFKELQFFTDLNYKILFINDKKVIFQRKELNS